jgi:Putative endonuclease, protein of unknown function (DUF1780)
MDRDEAEYLKKLRDHVTETRSFFGPKMKPERERTVCRAFLRCSGVKFEESEIIASKTEPVDVEFRSAKFQIRELIESGRKRGDELKKLQQKYASATAIEDLATPYAPSQPLSFDALVPELTIALQEKAAKYGSGCHDLDALVYVNLEGQHLDAKSLIPDMSQLKNQGWRSVSVIFAPWGVVLFAQTTAPEFLQNLSGQVLADWEEWDNIFDE